MINRLSDVFERKGIQSVEVGLRIAKVLAGRDGPMQLKEVALTSGLSSSVVHRYLASLIRAGMVRQLPDGRYDLAGLACRLGFAAIDRLSFLPLVEQRMRSLAVDADCSVMLSLWSKQGPIVVRMLHGRRTIPTTISVGSVLPPERSATGAVFLAWHPEARHLSKQSSNSARTRQVRCAGSSSMRGDLVPGLLAIAVPVFETGEMVAAVTIIEIDDAEQGITAEQLVDWVGRLSEELDAKASPPIHTCHRNADRPRAMRLEPVSD